MTAETPFPENWCGPATTVAFATLGCKANQYDTAFLEAQLQARQFRLVDFKDRADIYVVNTCSVTDSADLDSRNLIRRARRRNPDAFTVVTGCYAQVSPREVAAVEGVDLVLGNDKKAKLFEYLERARPARVRIEVEDIFRQKELETFGSVATPHRTRAFVKIQDGCNQFCSFCIIPYARGRNRSVPIARIVDELKQLSAQGFYEAVLTGIHIGTYGHDQDPPVSLFDLMQALEKEKPIHRVRVSSIDPEEVSPAMIELWSGSRLFCPHLHIPLQSGDDATLEMMRRRYRSRQFMRLCEELAAKIPRLCLGTDVIVGFPYEDEARFQNTHDLLSRAPLHYFHVFPFSPKRDTRAARMLGQCPHDVKKRRAVGLRALSAEKFARFQRSFLGERVEVILEQPSPPGAGAAVASAWMGISENYLNVEVELASARRGLRVDCRIKHLRGDTLVGNIDP